jgi:asparagine synthase (glutamine-hydrolysing)
MDQPLADPSCIALYFVSRLASEYVKVVLSGEGADELFGGYTCYNDPRVFKVYQKVVPYCIRKAICKVAKKLPDIKGRDYLIRATHPLEERFIGNAFMYDYDQKRELLKDPSIATRPQKLTRRIYYRTRRQDDVTRMQTLDINLWMVGDILLKADRMSMANSLELRVPFLDKEVFKVASKLPTHLRCNKQNTKYAMRKAAQRHLPIETAEKEKLGFPVPTRVWLRDKKYYDVVKKAFTSETAEKFFNTEILVNWLDVHYSEKEDNSRKIWTVYIFLVWYNIYFADDSNKVEKPQNHLVELKAKAEAQRKLARQQEAIAKVRDELAQQEGIGDDGYVNNSAEDVEDAFEEAEDERIASKFQTLQDSIIGLATPEDETNLTPLQKAEEVAMGLVIEDEDFDGAIEEETEDEPVEEKEEFVDITNQSEITDNNGVIRDDVIDSILSDVDDLKNN